MYAATGAIDTSDAREKTAIAPNPYTVKRAVRRIVEGMGVYQWLASVETARACDVGVTAQAVVAEACPAEGEDDKRWALFCRDETPDGAPLGLRYEQVLLLALTAL